MWLIELYLNELGELRDGGEQKRQEFEGVQDDFRKLLATSKVKVLKIRIPRFDYSHLQDLQTYK